MCSTPHMSALSFSPFSPSPIFSPSSLPFFSPHFFSPLCHPFSLPCLCLSLISSISSSLHLPLSLLMFLPLPSGLSKSFPLDNSLFDSWLAQSVQITADDMLSQWALGAQHRDKSGSLLSDQVGLQQQEACKVMPHYF